MTSPALHDGPRRVPPKAALRMVETHLRYKAKQLRAVAENCRHNAPGFRDPDAHRHHADLLEKRAKQFDRVAAHLLALTNRQGGGGV